MTHKRYLVTGRRRYRWHDPGTVFEAQLEPDAERRAIERGSIQIVEVVQPKVENGSYALPDDWSQQKAANGQINQEAHSHLVSTSEEVNR